MDCVERGWGEAGKGRGRRPWVVGGDVQRWLECGWWGGRGGLGLCRLAVRAACFQRGSKQRSLEKATVCEVEDCGQAKIRDRLHCLRGWHRNSPSSRKNSRPTARKGHCLQRGRRQTRPFASVQKARGTERVHNSALPNERHHPIFITTLPSCHPRRNLWRESASRTLTNVTSRQWAEHPASRRAKTTPALSRFATHAICCRLKR